MQIPHPLAFESHFTPGCVWNEPPGTVHAPTVSVCTGHVHRPALRGTGTTCWRQPQLPATSPVTTEKLPASCLVWELLRGATQLKFQPTALPPPSVRQVLLLSHPCESPCDSPTPAGLLAPTTRLPSCPQPFSSHRGTELPRPQQQRERTRPPSHPTPSPEPGQGPDCSQVFLANGSG